MNLTTPDNVKALIEADLNVWQETWDTLLGYLIAAVSRACETYCNREFEARERVEVYDGGGRFIFLRCLPVISIAAVKISDEWNWDAVTPEEPSEYAFDAATGMVQFRNFIWPCGALGVQVTYTGGYLTIPADLERAAATQVAYEFKRRKDVGLESVSMPDGSIQKVAAAEFLPAVKPILDRYRLRKVG